MTRGFPGETPHGGVAQLGEHLLCKQGVIGSIPFTSTSFGAPSGPRVEAQAAGDACVLPFTLRVKRLFFNNLEEDIVFSLFDLDTGCDCIHNESLFSF